MYIKYPNLGRKNHKQELNIIITDKLLDYKLTEVNTFFSMINTFQFNVYEPKIRFSQ